MGKSVQHKDKQKKGSKTSNTKNKSNLKEKKLILLSEVINSDQESDYNDDVFQNETLADRFFALKDILPPKARSRILYLIEYATKYLNCILQGTGSILWKLTSSALLLGVPLSLAILSETQLQEMEKEMTFQQSAKEIITPSSDDSEKKD